MILTDVHFKYYEHSWQMNTKKKKKKKKRTKSKENKPINWLKQRNKNIG